MNDEDTESFADLFDSPQMSDHVPVSLRSKPDYVSVHLPASLIEILEIWTSLPSPPSCRVGISPGDSVSLDIMFEHMWGESHIEQPCRLTAIIRHFHDKLWLERQSRWQCVPGRMVTNEQIRLVHSETFLSGFLAVERGETVDDVPSMRTLSYANASYNFQSAGPIIARACRTAAGTVINLVSSIVRGEIDFGFALVRPAGHHSSTDQVGTFCGFNSVAMAAVYAVRTLRVQRVLILDWDVHRSGGTEEILGRMSNEDQQKYRLIDIYAAFGKTSNCNDVPLNCHLIDLFDRNQIPGDDEYLKTFDLKVIADIVQFRPSLILISAGFDAAKGEAEECARLTPDGYGRMTTKLKRTQNSSDIRIGRWLS